MKGACATIPVAPITALPTPEPICIRVAGFAVAMNSVDENAADKVVAAPPEPAIASARIPCGEIALLSSV